ncbi:hypothetical protein [Nocardioides psychrotolerans]|uniref:hypothetical protein n=1 Tax=Nocardioides psychrotolerans TaxID=1005945 RepID=UPI0031377F35
MNDLTTTPTSDAPITLAVQIDQRRAQLLWQNASPVAGFDLADRFELVDSDDCSVLHEAAAWVDGMVMWCEGTLEAIMLTAYEDEQRVHSPPSVGPDLRVGLVQRLRSPHVTSRRLLIRHLGPRGSSRAPAIGGGEERVALLPTVHGCTP